MSTVQISARIDKALKKAVDEYCKARGIVLNHFVQEALVEELEDIERRVVKAVLALGEDPMRKGSRKLTGYDDVFRIRVGRYRVVYSVFRRTLVIIFLKVGDRKDVYR